MPKIKYGLKNCYYAVATIATDGSATYGDPVAIPGAVSLNLDAEGDRSTFYADNMEYWISPGNDGYDGDLEVALIPDSFKADVLGEADDANDVMYEDAASEIVHFALLYQFETDSKARRHVMYNCTAGRPTVSGSTKEGSISPETETIPITAKSIFVPGIGVAGKDVVKASTKESTKTSVYEGWFSGVYTVTTTTAT